MWFLAIRQHQLHFTDRKIKSEEQEICKHLQWVLLIHPYASTAGGREAVSARSYRTCRITESPSSSVLDAVELCILNWVNSAVPRVAGGMGARGGNGNSTHPHVWTQDTVPAKPSAHCCTQRMPRSVLLRSSLTLTSKGVTFSSVKIKLELCAGDRVIFSVP